MDTLKRLLTILMTGVLLATAACGSQPAPTSTVSTPPAPSPGALSPVRFEQGPCPFTVPASATKEITCGFVVVPEDHSNLAGPTIRLAVVVVKSRTSTRPREPVMLLSGGPGEKTVASALGMASLLAPIYGESDLVIFDQRGVGLSEPALECPEFVATLYELLDEDEPSIRLQASYESIAACHSRLVTEGRNLSAYNTMQNAADVNAIRVALGYEKVNLLGGSYGSLLAQTVMRDHPQGVQSAVLFATLPLEKSLYVGASVTSAQALMRLIDACAADSGCSTAYPNLKDVLFQTVDRLNNKPVPVTLTHPLTGKTFPAVLSGDAVLGNLMLLLYQTELIPIMPRATYEVYGGNYALMTQLLSRNLALYEAVSRGMQYSVLCSEDLVGRNPQEILDNRAALPTQLAGRVSPEVEMEYGSFATCRNWQVQELGPGAKKPLVTDIPTLVISGEFDPVTPPEYGQLVASLLSKSRHINLKGFGHNVISSECLRDLAGAFFKDPTAAPEADCSANLTGVTFDLPSKTVALKLIPYSDAKRGFSGLIPDGWKNLQESNMMRANTALDPAYFVLEAQPGRAVDLFENLMGQLKQEPRPGPVKIAKLGNFAWDLYAFDRRGNPVDLAIAEDDRKAYFVYMMSPPDERDALYDQLFVPAVKAMASLP